MSEILDHERHKKTGKHKQNKKFIKVDLTPMVDLGFLLIAFFVFTTSVTHPTAMNLVLPDDEDVLTPNEAPASKTLNLLLAANNEVYVYNGNSLNEVSNLEAKTTALRHAIVSKKNDLKTRYGTDSGIIVLIKPTLYATYANVVDALDEMQICDVKTYVLMDPAKTELEKIGER